MTTFETTSVKRDPVIYNKDKAKILNTEKNYIDPEYF